MRVIGGKLRGKLIHNPTDKTTRPLKEMVRESIFNILEHSKNEKIKFKNDIVLDLFSGSGSFGIECLSRGVKKVFFFENYKPSLKVLEKNIKGLKIDKDSVIKEINAYEISKENIKKEFSNINTLYLSNFDGKLIFFSTFNNLLIGTPISMHFNSPMKDKAESWVNPILLRPIAKV